MKLAAAAALLFLALPVAAQAALSRAQLDTVSAAPPPQARLDLDLAARDPGGRMRRLGDLLGGRSAFLIFADYTCNTLCGTELALLSGAIASSHLAPSQYRIVVMGLDPKDPAKAARTMERKEIPAALWPDTTLLLPDEATVRRATAALGFHYVYDPGADQFAHPAVVYVVGADGALRATLSPFALATTDLRSVFARSPDSAGLFERVHLLCYAYDPATGIYSLRIALLLKFAAVVTLMAIATAVGAMMLRSRRKLA